MYVKDMDMHIKWCDEYIDALLKIHESLTPELTKKLEQLTDLTGIDGLINGAANTIANYRNLMVKTRDEATVDWPI